MDPFVILYSLFGPFLVWPIEYILPYPYIVEEFFKLLVVKFTNGNTKSYILAGVLFALTETVFYSFNINLFGNLSLFFVRFTATSLLHATTFLIIFKLSKKENGLILGFLVSVLIHYLYNRYIPMY